MYRIYGVDISLKNIAIVDSAGRVFLSMSTGLSLKSTPVDIISIGTSILSLCPDIDNTDHIFIDYTSRTFANRAHQIALFNLFVGAVFAQCSTNNLNFITPSEVRKVVGLSARAKKEEVWQAYGIVESLFKTEHEKDAFVLAIYGKEFNL